MFNKETFWENTAGIFTFIDDSDDFDAILLKSVKELKELLIKVQNDYNQFIKDLPINFEEAIGFCRYNCIYYGICYYIKKQFKIDVYDNEILQKYCYYEYTFFSKPPKHSTSRDEILQSLQSRVDTIQKIIDTEE